jgi:hypothetical protein
MFACPKASVRAALTTIRSGFPGSARKRQIDHGFIEKNIAFPDYAKTLRQGSSAAPGRFCGLPASIWAGSGNQRRGLWV